MSTKNYTENRYLNVTWSQSWNTFKLQAHPPEVAPCTVGKGWGGPWGQIINPLSTTFKLVGNKLYLTLWYPHPNKIVFPNESINWRSRHRITRGLGLGHNFLWDGSMIITFTIIRFIPPTHRVENRILLGHGKLIKWSKDFCTKNGAIERNIFSSLKNYRL